MTFETTIQMLRLRGDAEPLDPRQWKWLAARYERALGLMKQWLDAMQRMDDRCTAAAERLFGPSSSLSSLGEGDHLEGGGGVDAAAWLEFNRIVEAEEAKVAALRARLEGFIERGE